MSSVMPYQAPMPWMSGETPTGWEAPRSAAKPLQAPNFTQASNVSGPAPTPTQTRGTNGRMYDAPQWAQAGANPWGSSGYRQDGRTSAVQLYGGGDSGDQATGYQFTYNDPNLQNLDTVTGGGWGGGAGGMAQGWDMYTDPNTGQKFYRIGDYNPNDDTQRRKGVSFDPSQVKYDEKYGYIVPEGGVGFDDFDIDGIGALIMAGIGGAALFGGAGPFSGMGGSGSAAAGSGLGGGSGFAPLGVDPLTLNTSAGSIGTLGPGFTGTASAGAGAAAAGGGLTSVPAGTGIAGSTVPSVGQLGTAATTNVAAGTPLATGAGTAAAGGLPSVSDILNGARTGSNLLNSVGAIRGVTGRGVGTQQGAQQAGRDAAAAADPFAPEREQYQKWLRENFSRLTSFDPQAVKNDPAYKFQMEQGTAAIDNAAAAGGMFNSGNRGVELTQFGQGLASKFTQDQFARNMAILSQVAGLGGANSGSPAAAGNALLSGFTGATNLQGNYLNQLLGGNGTGGNIFDIIGGVTKGASGLWDWLKG